MLDRLHWLDARLAADSKYFSLSYMELPNLIAKTMKYTEAIFLPGCLDHPCKWLLTLHLSSDIL